MLSEIKLGGQHRVNPEVVAVRMQTIRTLLEGYKSLSVTQLLKPLAQEFVHQVLPRSLCMPPRNRTEFARHAEGIFSIFRSFEMVPEAIYDDELRGVVIIHARMEGILKSTEDSWINECFLMVTLSPDHKEVVEISEFVDSAKAVEMKQRYAPKDFGGVEEEQRKGRKRQRRLSW
ncbi:hypothetical protein QBC47DRAFT_291716 [Echria macrotheca]|uniref:Uncharacterized protein n=1 Tax=Echria macrotheca TaxID=438768 RepID=A0AAJ0FG62_9PEZI|nr:hypothetical protein QBC47DRAFT_291716 [Echria macrotheca]